MIPHLCPDLPDKQKEALGYGVKVPLVYANVLLKDGRAFSKLDATLVTCPRDPFTMVSCAPITTTGGYEPPRGPDDPMVVLMMANPTPPPEGDESLRELLRKGRMKVYTTSFETYEKRARWGKQAREARMASPSNPILNTPSIAMLNTWVDWLLNSAS